MKRTTKVTLKKLTRTGKHSRSAVQVFWIGHQERGAPQFKKLKPDFGQDLDSDGKVGISTTGLTSIATDTTGETLKKNSAGELFIILQMVTIFQSKTRQGFNLFFDGTETFDDGTSVSKEAYAVESFTNSDVTFYKLIIRVKETLENTTTTAYETFTLNSSGELDWTTFAYSEKPTAWEKVFNQDIDGNGSIDSVGSNSNVADINTDSTGARLQIDDNNVLYIKDSGNRITVTDSNGGTPTFSVSETYDSGTFTSTPVAVEKQSDNTYLLAIREEDVYNNETNTNWGIYTLSETGVLSWDASFKIESELDEKAFNQDLNGDGNQSSGVSEATSSLASLVNTGTTDSSVLAKFRKHGSVRHHFNSRKER